MHFLVILAKLEKIMFKIQYFTNVFWIFSFLYKLSRHTPYHTHNINVLHI